MGASIRIKILDHNYFKQIPEKLGYVFEKLLHTYYSMAAISNIKKN